MPRRDSLRLEARPPTQGGAARHGSYRLDVGGPDALLRVPAEAAANPPLLVLLHDDELDPAQALALLPEDGALAPGLAVLCPGARAGSWRLHDPAGADDVLRLDAALSAVFAEHVPAPSSLALAGIGTGGASALELGLANGDVFRRLVALAPSPVEVGTPTGAPSVHLVYGAHDPVAATEQGGRALAARLREAGLDVVDQPFDGGRELPAELLAQALAAVARS